MIKNCIPVKSIRPEMIVGALLGMLGGWVTFMAFDNTQPYEYDAENSFITPSPASPGDQVTVKWRLAKVNRICPGIVNRILFDPVTKAILVNYDPQLAATTESIKEGYLHKTFLLPKTLPAGKAAYRSDVCYTCNRFQYFVRPLCGPTPTLIFEVK